MEWEREEGERGDGYVRLYPHLIGLKMVSVSWRHPSRLRSVSPLRSVWGGHE